MGFTIIFFALIGKIAGTILCLWLFPFVESKLFQLLDLMRANNWHAAIRFASKFPRLGSHRDDILRAKDAFQNPDFYRQMGKDPESLVQAGIEALKSKYLRS